MLVQKHLSSGRGFEAKNVAVVTWDRVGHYDRSSGSNATNTFQACVAGDGRDTFVLLAYPQDGLGWIHGDGKQPNLADARAQAGFVAGDGRFHLLPASGSDQVTSLNRFVPSPPSSKVIAIESTGTATIDVDDASLS